MKHAFWARGLVFALALLTIAPAHADDLSNGSWSTTDASNNALPPNGWPAGMFPNQVEPTARSNMGGIKRWWERENAAITTSGSAGAYVYTPTNTAYPTAYTNGEIYCAKTNFASVGADTLNVNSLGAKALYMPSGAGAIAITAGALPNAQQFCAVYDASLNSAGGGFLVVSNTGTSSVFVNSVGGGYTASGMPSNIGITSVTGASRYLVTTSFSEWYENNNGTPCTPAITIAVKDGSTSLISKTYSASSVAISYNAPITFAFSFIVPQPAANALTVTAADAEGDGCSKIWYQANFSASASGL